MSGLDLQAKLNAEHCPIPTIFITARGDEKTRLQAMRGGAVKFLVKPFDGAILLESVRTALKRSVRKSDLCGEGLSEVGYGGLRNTSA